MFLNGNTFQKSYCRYVQQPHWDGVILLVILFKLQFLHLHLAMLVWYISVQKKKKTQQKKIHAGLKHRVTYKSKNIVQY